MQHPDHWQEESPFSARPILPSKVHLWIIITLACQISYASTVWARDPNEIKLLEKNKEDDG